MSSIAFHLSENNIPFKPLLNKPLVQKNQRSSKRFIQTDPRLCKYQSKACFEYRAKKKSGHLHSLCELHRGKANLHQQKLDRKRLRDSGKKQTSQSNKAVKRNSLFSLTNPSYQVEQSNTTPKAMKIDYLFSLTSPYYQVEQLNPTPLANRVQLDMDDLSFLIECFTQKTERKPCEFSTTFETCQPLQKFQALLSPQPPSPGKLELRHYLKDIVNNPTQETAPKRNRPELNYF